MKSIIILVVYSLIPISLFGMVAFLMFHGTEGWGWLLTCVTLFLCAFDVSVGKKEQPEVES